MFPVRFRAGADVQREIQRSGVMAFADLCRHLAAVGRTKTRKSPREGGRREGVKGIGYIDKRVSLLSRPSRGCIGIDYVAYRARSIQCNACNSDMVATMRALIEMTIGIIFHARSSSIF